MSKDKVTKKYTHTSSLHLYSHICQSWVLWHVCGQQLHIRHYQFPPIEMMDLLSSGWL